tara:strand:+ start:976 stop:1560 length:585 start_codon:yes stop_codon:yes gene_type:complete
MGQFITTKQTITNEISEVADQLTINFNGLSDLWYESLPNSDWTAKEIAEHIYLVNQYVISKVKYTKGLILEGFVNNEIDYEESDLKVVDIMLAVSLYRVEAPAEFTRSLCFSAEEMKLKLIYQLKVMHSLLKELPEEMINNYKEHSKFISGIKLDLYQLIYLSIIHCKHHLSQISTLKEIEQALAQEELVSVYC